MNALIRPAPWITLTGVVMLLTGLIRDARMHRLDPTLAAREGVFTMANPAHALFAVGVALVVAGTVLFLVGKASRRSGSSPVVRTVSVMLAALLVVLSMVTFASAVAGSGDSGHSHDGMHVPPAQGPATPEQKAAAEKLLRDVKAGIARYTDLKAALAEGYKQTTPWRYLRWGPAHFHNRVLNGDGRWLDPEYPESLMYFKLPDGNIVLIGAMFVAPKGEGSRPGGPLTEWHTHDNLCLTATGKVALATGPGQCPPGSFFLGESVEMLHIWTFNNPDGPFAHSLSEQAIQAIVKQYSNGR